MMIRFVPRNTVTALIALTASIFAAPHAFADVVKQDENGFVIAHQVEVAASADDAYAMLRAPAKWWSPDHSWTGDASNFYMDAQATGCFCELIPADKEGGPRGSVEHMRIIYAQPGKMLRLSGSLGPLQAEAVQGSMTISLKPSDSGTIVLFEYVVGGYMRFPVERIAPAVDNVIGEQTARLAKALGPVAQSPDNDDAADKGKGAATDASDADDDNAPEDTQSDDADDADS